MKYIISFNGEEYRVESYRELVLSVFKREFKNNGD
jgi:hypothetical protein